MHASRNTNLLVLDLRCHDERGSREAKKKVRRSGLRTRSPIDIGEETWKGETVGPLFLPCRRSDMLNQGRVRKPGQECPAFSD